MLTLNRTAIAAVTLALLVVLALLTAYLAGWLPGSPGAAHRWSEGELASLTSLSIDRLPPLPPSPSNRVADDPQAVALGHALFFDTNLSGDGTVSCASCHRPELYFTDGLPQARVRDADTPRHTPTIVGTAYNDWYYWDGRKDSQWSQALSPVEAPLEHGGNRAQYVHLVANRYETAYEALFGPLPDVADENRFPASAGPVDDAEAAAAWEALAEEDRDAINRVFANVGKAIAAYERRILPGRSRFDDYVAAAAAGDRARMADLFTTEEAAGLRLFVGRAQCTNCHNGPLLTNGSFHNLGLPLAPGEGLDQGRLQGVKTALEDPFNCLGPYSDAESADCAELRFAKTEGEELLGAFKTPSLRNVALTAPYMHNGIFADLDAVLAHYNAAPPAFPGHSDLEPLELSPAQRNQLKAFLHTLSAEPSAPPELLQPPEG